MADKRRKWGTILGLALIAILLFLLCLQIFRGVAIDSDFSNLVLEGYDIRSGNIFLRDWNLTGISFLTTDLLFFVIATFFLGATVDAYYLAITLMFVVVALLSLLLVGDLTRKNAILVLALWLAIGAIPVGGAPMHLRAHTAVWAYVFVAYFLAERILAGKARRPRLCYTLFIASMALGVVGDAIIILAGILPILFVFFYQFLLNHSKFTIKTPGTLLCAASILGLVLGTLLDKLYFIVGGANKNSFLSNLAFDPLRDIGDNFILYVEGILDLFGARFMSQPVLSIWMPWYLIRILIILFGAFLVIYHVVTFLTGRSQDLISVFLSLGFVFLSLFYILTSASVDINSTRYFGYLPLMFSILIIRWLRLSNLPDRNIFGHTLNFRHLLIFVSALAIAFSVLNIIRIPRATSGREELVSFLRNENLVSGYAGFWDASSSTVTSGNNVHIRAVEENEGDLQPLYWFCKTSWYDEPANFVVIGNGYGNLTEESVGRALGPPDRRAEVGGYIVYIYDGDLSTAIVKEY